MPTARPPVRSSLAALSCAMAFALHAAPALASNVNVGATASGFYNSLGNGFPSGYFLGNCPNCSPSGEARAYVVFDLTGVTDLITSATLRLSMPSGGYLSPDPSETVGLWDVSTPLATLAAAGAGVAGFNDLGGGMSLGGGSVPETSGNTIVQFDLNAAGLQALNAARGQSFALGLSLLSITSPSNNEVLFNNSGSPALTRQLALVTSPIPEPTSAWMLGMGVAGLLWAGAGRRRSDSATRA